MGVQAEFGVLFRIGKGTGLHGGVQMHVRDVEGRGRRRAGAFDLGLSVVLK